MTTQRTFLIRATSGKEAVMRLPIDRYGGITHKGREKVEQRFYDGSTNKKHGVQYALCLEAFNSADDLIHALNKYNKNII